MRVIETALKYVGDKELFGNVFTENTELGKTIKRFENNIFYSPCGCHYWVGNQRKKQGYGGFRYKGKMMLSHRVSYILYKGEFDSSLSVCHSCDNPMCVNPYHLFLGTHQDNMTDMKNKGRYKVQKGSNHYNSKLTENNVRCILNLLKDGVKQNVIAKMYGVHKGTIQSIADGSQWKHVRI